MMPLEYACPSNSTSQLYCIYNELHEQLDLLNIAASAQERKQEIMNLLHEFNDVKDAAQIVLGSLANLEGKTIKELHLLYNLPLNE